MRKLFTLMFVGLLALPCAATTITVTNTTSTVVLPRTGQITTVARSNNTAYANGAYVSIGDFKYMCLVAGTSDSSAPALTAGDIVDGTVVWRPVRVNPRLGLTVSVNDGTSVIRLDFATSVATNAGIRLPGATLILDNPTSVPQSAVSVRADAAAVVTVSATEW